MTAYSYQRIFFLSMVPKVKAGKFLLGRRGPLDDQGVLIPIVFREDPNDPKPYRLVESESPRITLSHLGPEASVRKRCPGLLEERFPNPFSTVVRVDRNGDEVPLLREDEVPTDFPQRLILRLFDVDPERFWVKPEELKECRARVGRFRERVLLDFQDAIEISEGKKTDHDLNTLRQMA
jgi:hypothetical protein